MRRSWHWTLTLVTAFTSWAAALMDSVRRTQSLALAFIRVDTEYPESPHAHAEAPSLARLPEAVAGAASSSSVGGNASRAQQIHVIQAWWHQPDPPARPLYVRNPMAPQLLG